MWTRQEQFIMNHLPPPNRIARTFQNFSTGQEFRSRHVSIHSHLLLWWYRALSPYTFLTLYGDNTLFISIITFIADVMSATYSFSGIGCLPLFAKWSSHQALKLTSPHSFPTIDLLLTIETSRANSTWSQSSYLQYVITHTVWYERFC